MKVKIEEKLLFQNYVCCEIYLFLHTYLTHIHIFTIKLNNLDIKKNKSNLINNFEIVFRNRNF